MERFGTDTDNAFRDKNAFQRGECDDREQKRYKTFKTIDEKVQSLDELLENAESMRYY